MTADEIRAAVAADPALQSASFEAIAVALSADRTMLAPTMISERRILSVLGAAHGGAFLDALDAFAATPLATDHPLAPVHSGIRRAIGWLKTNEGLDIGDPEAQAMLDGLAATGVVDPAHAQVVKDLARVPDVVQAYEVQRALQA